MRQRKGNQTAFTLLELMIVVGIIAVLIGILIPVIGRVRERAYAADTKNFISQLSAAIEAYQQEFRSYPGPLANNEIRNATNTAPYLQAGVTGFSGTSAIQPYSAPSVVGFDTTQPDFASKLTMSENLVLGLLGGLRIHPGTGGLVYDPSLVGRGAMSLNAANPKRFEPYLSGDSHLSWRDTPAGKTGKYMDGTNFEIDDTLIPEFVDSFPESMPILYLRAKPGVAVIPNTTPGYGQNLNSVVTDDPGFAQGRPGAYDLSQIYAYTASYNGMGAQPAIEIAPASYAGLPNGSRSIGTAKNPPKTYYQNGNDTAYTFPYHGLRTVNTAAKLVPGAGYYLPYDAFPYFQNPATPNTARNKDSYLLIAAGPDRMYGTADDIVSFGSVGE